MRKVQRYKALVIVITYVFVEFICYLFIKTDYVKAGLPDFHYQLTLKDYPFLVADIDTVWGTWHYRESVHRTEDCERFDYDISSIGTRDIERTKNSTDTNRVLVLGDSFMEGYGIPIEGRISNRLESLTHREFLNFACSDFGTTQEWLVYEKLGKQFDHSTVLLGFFPYNDFTDNDTSANVNPYYKRYKPYFKGKYPDYKLIYVEDSIQKATFNKAGFLKKENSPRGRLVRFLRAFTCWFHIVCYIKDLYYSPKAGPVPGYYHYTSDNWEKMQFILKKIRTSAIYKQMIIVSFPTPKEIKQFRELGPGPLSEALSAFCKENHITYVDLLPLLAEQENAEKKFYFDCDYHLNEAGNKFAAAALARVFRP
ncbi:MAG TPA: SGNH/GDSL hydrolase family protein [Puia sp.]|nr:SGNH/GDSL hydrolase family protein [Puia sp.]